MALDVATGILIAGAVFGMLALGMWIFIQGANENQGGMIVRGGVLILVALASAGWFIASRLLH